MGDLKQKKATYAPAYVVGIYPELAERARSLGYALALHGSVQRDLDLVAIPWVEYAASPDYLVQSLCSAFDLETKPTEGELRPHGRITWSIPLWWGAYIDLSVIPPKERSDD